MYRGVAARSDKSEGDGEGGRLGFTVGLVEFWVGVGVGGGIAEGVGDGVGVWEGVGIIVGVSVGFGLKVGVGVGEGVCIGVSVM